MRTYAWVSGLLLVVTVVAKRQALLPTWQTYVTSSSPTISTRLKSRPAFYFASNNTTHQRPSPSIAMATEIVFETGEPTKRPVVAYSSLPELSAPFFIDPASRSYKHQYSNIYFVRLVELRPIVEEHAAERWANVRGELTTFPPVSLLMNRQPTTPAAHPQPPARAAMLHRRHGVHGHAPQAERARGDGPECKLPLFQPS